VNVRQRIDISDYLREYHETGEVLLRAKWIMDGAESLAEAAEYLRGFADELDALAAAGFHLMGPIEDDHGFAHRGDEGLSEDRPAQRREDRALRQLNEEGGAMPAVSEDAT
jgi:hypothetical protein